MYKAIRGAATVRSNTADDIMAATQELMREVVKSNDLRVDHIISAIFTLTPDLNAAFPAAAARAMGWTEVPMICAQEIPVPGALPMVVRVLIHANMTGPVYPVYLGGAVALRPDLVARQR